MKTLALLAALALYWQAQALLVIADLLAGEPQEPPEDVETAEAADRYIRSGRLA